MKKAHLLFVAVMLLAVLMGCAQTVSEASAQNDSDVDIQNTPDASVQLPKEEESAVVEQSVSETSEQSFDALELVVDKGSLYVRTGDSFSYTTHNGKEGDYTINGSTLYIHQQQSEETVLTLPEDQTCISLQLTVKEGHVYTECALSLQTLELNIAQGEATLGDIFVTDSSSVEIRHGSVFLSGDLGTSVTVDSREGDIRLETSAAQNDYNFEVELSEGKLHLGTEDFTGRSVSRSIDNSADRSMTLSCSRGDMSIEFDR